MCSLMIHSITSSRKAELDQFAQGLDLLLIEAKKAPEMFKPLFVYNQNTVKLNAENFKDILDISCLEDNLREHLQKYIDSKGTCPCCMLLFIYLSTYFYNSQLSNDTEAVKPSLADSTAC